MGTRQAPRLAPEGALPRQDGLALRLQLGSLRVGRLGLDALLLLGLVCELWPDP